MPIVECVPNFSEGRNKAVIDQITRAIGAVEGAAVLDVDPGQANNIMVVTLVGSPMRWSRPPSAASRRPRSSSTCRSTTASTRAWVPPTCARSYRWGAVPAAPPWTSAWHSPAGWANASAASSASRSISTIRRTAGPPEPGHIRAGEYEALAQKLADPQWKPEFGPTTFNAKSGATVIGARQFLVAYNVNLNTRDRRLANDVAFAVREGGRAKRDAAGEIVRNPDGSSVKVPGRLKAVKGVGWFIQEYDRAQISMNRRLRRLPPHAAFDARRGARARPAHRLGAGRPHLRGDAHGRAARAAQAGDPLATPTPARGDRDPVVGCARSPSTPQKIIEVASARSGKKLCGRLTA
jgi:glutamate formiminotransferase/formiminotetrahydrofolate cyclodeaminase